MEYEIRLYTPMPNGTRAGERFTKGTVYAAVFELDENKTPKETGSLHDNDGSHHYFDPNDKVYNSYWVEVGKRTIHSE